MLMNVHPTISPRLCYERRLTAVWSGAAAAGCPGPGMLDESMQRTSWNEACKRVSMLPELLAAQNVESPALMQQIEALRSFNTESYTLGGQFILHRAGKVPGQMQMRARTSTSNNLLVGASISFGPLYTISMGSSQPRKSRMICTEKFSSSHAGRVMHPHAPLLM